MVTVSITNPDDLGPGTLREALFIAAAANERASVVIRARKITLRTPLPPLVNPHGLMIIAEPAGAEIDAGMLGGGAVFDVVGDNTTIAGVVLRNCKGTAVLLRAAHFHLQSSTIESCDVGVDIAPNAAHLLIERNLFQGDRIGVRFAAPEVDAAVAGNAVRQARLAGVWAVRGDAAGRDAADGAIDVRDDRFIGDNSGVVAGNVPILVENDDFSGDGPDAAVHLVGADAVVRNNRIGDSGAQGIVAEMAGGAVIEGNVLTRLRLYGIVVRDSAGALVRDNRMEDCAAGMAFVLGDPARPSTAQGNLVVGPTLDGIDVIGASPRLLDNQVLRPHALALHVVDYDPATGPSVRARPSLSGNNFRPNALPASPSVARAVVRQP